LNEIRIAFDSNILLYLSGLAKLPADVTKIADSRKLHTELSLRFDCVMPLQTAGEVYSVLSRSGISRIEARDGVMDLKKQFEIAVADAGTFDAALDLATEHQLQFWDALILNVAADAGCTLLLSEDMQDGFAWRGVTVVNPFAKKMHKRLARVLEA
jgi:predicted nucleic acid-binding protein